MNEALTRHLLLPLHERLRGRETIGHYRHLRANEGGSPEALAVQREAKLQALADHCLAQVPFYRERLRAAGIASGADLTLDRLGDLPPLERAEIREHLADLCAVDHRGELIRYTTGGSTGAPLVFYTDLRKEARHNAHKLRYRAWHGVRPGDRQVDFWGSPIELSKQTRFRLWKDRRLLNHRLLSAFDLTEARLDTYIDELRRFRPSLVYGYPTVIHRVALRMGERGIRAEGWPRLVATTAEMLLDHQRAAIAEAFGCPVANEYGSRDAGLVAAECPRGRLHVAAEHVVAEVDAPDSEGVGDLLITNLDAYGMPLLRYRVGDRGWLDDGGCDCGLPLPVIGGVAGRSNDFLVGGGGRLVHSLAPIYVLREIPAISQFRLYQRPDRSLEVALVTGRELTSEELDGIRTGLLKALDLDVEVAFAFPEVIAPEASGKYRWVVSEAEAGP
ncbi:phenylacetate--CoA ligase family protein [Thiohalorhabdus sp.]|uniref:phenylacetate--CoA ligase family protein n=1 Tax=Thiohalorhabdus sp. TaxID=3094134 RepID=UPI002FC3B6BC